MHKVLSIEPLLCLRSSGTSFGKLMMGDCICLSSGWTCRKTVACTKSHPANFWVEPLCNKAARTIIVLVLNKPLSQTNWKQGEICSEDIWITLFPEQNFILEVQEVSSYTVSSLLLDMNVELHTFFPPQVRLSALQALREMHKKLGEDYLNLLPETMPFISELMEGKCARVCLMVSFKWCSYGVKIRTWLGGGWDCCLKPCPSSVSWGKVSVLMICSLVHFKLCSYGMRIIRGRGWDGYLSFKWYG